MDEADSRLLMGPEPSVLVSVVQALSDPNSLVVLLVTLFGFLLPMLWIYPPVAPRPSDFLNETHSQLRVDEKKEDKEDEKRQLRNNGGMAPRIDSLWVYPVKSCRGIQVSRSRVLPTGLEFDRLFTLAQLASPFPARAGTELVAKTKTGRHGNGKDNGNDGAEADDTWAAIDRHQFPMLATLQVELWRPDLAKVRRAQARMRADDRAERTASMSELYVVVRYPWQATGWVGRWDWFAAKLARGWRSVPEVEVVLPLALPVAADKATAKYGHVRIDDTRTQALDVSAELPRSLQLYLGVSNRLGLFRCEVDHPLRQALQTLNNYQMPPGGNYVQILLPLPPKAYQ
ncbi:hypothetical protein SPBR_00654 [Sporothrix brasiliensis 5110]|uniref:Molybdenum cofactor sulfurase middle domain-containing protein n=1 Tax=Sporothrix brasiliensis 5110 TaxID=1398154 RepID=A0A0C2ITF1_9PEZI|nr:uncharacterized protein SPBR_00654 [Sporothrix brasiliensis 5110]KIH90090.1 hypothetical protein SPBR_00654 [Sporothrix brasiliensis 5110]